jgi:hypothetical protein
MIETDRLIAPAPASPQEEQIERALRPRTLAEYVGQGKARAHTDARPIWAGQVVHRLIFRRFKHDRNPHNPEGFITSGMGKKE